MNSPINPRRLSASPKTGYAISIVTGGAKYCNDDTRAALRVRIKCSIRKNDKRCAGKFRITPNENSHTDKPRQNPKPLIKMAAFSQQIRRNQGGCIAAISAADPALMPNSSAFRTAISHRKCPKNPTSKLRWSGQCHSDRKLTWAPTSGTAIT